MKEKKEKIRIQTLEKRCLLSEQQTREKSRRIFEKLMLLKAFKESFVILCYVDFRNEVITRDFIKDCLGMGKRVTVPRIEKVAQNHSEMKALEIRNPENDLEKGHFGILEPVKEIHCEVSPWEIDLVVVPGVAFSRDRHRIGYGAGYYDRFLQQVRESCLKVGIAFECQMVDSIPVEAHDIPLDLIITEEREI